MGAGMLGAAAVGGAVSTAGSLLERAIFGSGKIKGKSATDRRIREQYQTMVQDLRAAGLNPALAYQSAHPTATATGTSMASHAGFDPATGMRAGIEGYKVHKKVGAEQRLLEAQRQGVEAGTAKTQAETIILSKGIPEAEIKKRWWQQISDIVGGYMDKGISPKGAELKVKELFKEKPSSARRTNDWQRIHPRHDYEDRMSDYNRRNQR